MNHGTPPLHRTPSYDPHNTPSHYLPRHTPPHNRPPHAAASVEEELKQGEISLAARIQMMQETMREIERNNESYRSRDRSSSRDLEARREEHRSTSAKMIGDPRVPCKSAFESEQRRNLFAPPPSHSTEEKFMEFQSEIQRSQANMMQTMQAMQATVTSLAEKVDQMIVRPPSPRSHCPPSKSLSPRQSETKSIESITPAPIAQDSVHRLVSLPHMQQVVTERVSLQCQEPRPAKLHLLAKASARQQSGNYNLPSFATDMRSHGHFQEICSKLGVNPLILSNSKQVEPVAVQVFEETPEPGVKAVGDESEGRKSQKPEAPQANQSAKVSGNQRVQIQQFNESKVHIHKSNEFLIDSLMDDDKLEMSWCVNKVQECKIQFPVTDSTESSYFVETDCKLDLVIFTPVAAPWFQVIRKDGEERERIGVG